MTIEKRLSDLPIVATRHATATSLVPSTEGV